MKAIFRKELPLDSYICNVSRLEKCDMGVISELDSEGRIVATGNTDSIMTLIGYIIDAGHDALESATNTNYINKIESNFFTTDLLTLKDGKVLALSSDQITLYHSMKDFNEMRTIDRQSIDLSI